MKGYDDWKLKPGPLYMSCDEFDDLDRANYCCNRCGAYIEDGEEYDCEYDEGWVLWHLDCPKRSA